MVDRRRLLVGGVATTAVVWTAPSIVTLDRVAAAQGSGSCELPIAGNGALLIPPPLTNQEGTAVLDSNINTFVWTETACEILDNPLTVNRSTAGSFNGGSNQGTVIPAGTEICSYYAHGDRLDDKGRLTGSLLFSSAQILGLIYRSAQLSASSFLEAPTTTYFSAPMEGSDLMTLNLAAGANQVTWDMKFGKSLDGIRIITTCV